MVPGTPPTGPPVQPGQIVIAVRDVFDGLTRVLRKGEALTIVGVTADPRRPGLIKYEAFSSELGRYLFLDPRNVRYPDAAVNTEESPDSRIRKTQRLLMGVTGTVEIVVGIIGLVYVFENYSALRQVSGWLSSDASTTPIPPAVTLVFVAVGLFFASFVLSAALAFKKPESVPALHLILGIIVLILTVTAIVLSRGEVSPFGALLFVGGVGMIVLSAICLRSRKRGSCWTTGY